MTGEPRLSVEGDAVLRFAPHTRFRFDEVRHAWIVLAPERLMLPDEQAVETVFESLKQALGRGQRIELRRFGVFSVKPRKTGIGRNPRTGEEVNIPPGKAVRFKPGKELQGIEETKKA